MRKLFTLLLIALLLGVGVVAIIETDPGYLLLAYGDYTLESSLWVGLLLLFFLTLALYLLIALVRRLVGGQKSLAGWLGSRRARQATRLTQRGLVNFVEGNWSRARRDLLRGVRENDTPLLNYLLAARASANLGEPEQTDQHLAAAEAGAGAKIAVALARAELQLQAGHYQQAVDTLREARRSPGRYPQALALLQRAYAGLDDGAALAELLPLLKKYRVLNADEVQRLEAEVYGRALTQAGDPARGGSLQALCDSWHTMPAAVRGTAAMTRQFAQMLVDLGDHVLAEKTLLRAMKQGWDPQLVRIYGYVQSDNVRRQLSQAESWLADHP
ncbi:MAG: heme biosynthesis protein HemY, partial [Halioglobus sp.]|nr:heme biosynthesis protein HemY [Halioglobus sp.]